MALFHSQTSCDKWNLTFSFLRFFSLLYCSDRLSVVTEIIFSPVTEFDRGPFQCIGFDLRGKAVGMVGQLKLKIRGNLFVTMKYIGR